MSTHNITQITERALREFIKLNVGDLLNSAGNVWLDELRIYRGIENRDNETMEGEESSTKGYPCVTVICNAAEPVLPWRGNWAVSGEIVVESSASDTTGDDHDALAGPVFDLFLANASLEADIQAALANFYCGKFIPGQQSIEASGGMFTSRQAFTLQSCCGTAMS